MSPPNSTVEVEEFRRAHPQIGFVDVLLADLNGIARGKRLTIDELPSAYRGGFLLPGSMFALDVLGGTIQETGLGFDEGDADRPCLPIEGSLVPAPWDGPKVAQIQVTMHEADGAGFYGDPRHVLAQVLSRFQALGLKCVVAHELEFYFVDRERTAEGRLQPPRGPATQRRQNQTQINSMADLSDYSKVLVDIAAACETQRVPCGTSLPEYGPGQFEVNLRHVDDALLACDHAVRLKRLVRSIAIQQGLDATFMPKPYADMAGSGAHLHVSVMDDTGRNIFAAPHADGSEMLKFAIGGLARTMADAMLIFAPTANSYRRFQSESYVPLDPNWGVNNRGVALRIPVSDAENRRVEHRVAGADANPYLLTAAILAGIHLGITQRIVPAPAVTGNAYRQTRNTLASNWPEAALAFERSDFIREYLGERFQHLYAATRRGELRAFEAHVSTLEHAWYARL